MFTNTKRVLAALLAGATTCMAAHAAGVLFTNDKPGNPQPLRWNTSQPIPVYTDLGVFTYDFDGTTPFITNERADELVAFGLNQWSKVPTSTLRARVAGDFTKVPSIGGDVTAKNFTKVWGAFNGGGMHVVYDTDGSILEEYFGISRYEVLGIAMPEFAEDTDGDGYEDTITEAVALMNGWAVSIDDPQANRFAGVITHEFGHAFNLSHSQVNGPMAYFSYPGPGEYFPGVPGCVAPVHAPGSGGNEIAASAIETMFPFIDPYSDRGREMSTIDRPDDIASLSNLYPTAAYRARTGSISGTLRLKDGRTPYSGINVIARNVADPMNDAVSAMTGAQTQGKTGPDGRFRINNLKPGQSYVLYMEEIAAGGYPTAPRMLVSEAEYWDVAESANPGTDTACAATPIVAQAGAPARADLVFNGYRDGVSYAPVTDGYLTDLSRDGGRAAGQYGPTQFVWDAKTGIEVLPASILANNGSMTRNGGKVIVNADLNQNGISSSAIYDFATAQVTDMGSLNGDTCGGSSEIGVASSYGWSLSDSGRAAVGTAYVDADGDGSCEGFSKPEILPFLWTEKGGMRLLDVRGHDFENLGWLRAHTISGDGSVVLGTSNFTSGHAWINGGRRIDLWKKFGATEAYAVNRDGTRVAMDTYKEVTITNPDGSTFPSVLNNGVMVWNPKTDTTIKLPALQWCKVLPIPPSYDWFTGELLDPCANWDQARIDSTYGQIPVGLFDMNDAGTVMIGRMGAFYLNVLEGAMWVDGLGWLKLSEFFRNQGVAEAYRLGMDSPAALNGAGNEMVGGLAGVPMTWYVDMKRVFVCQGGQSSQVGFPAAAVSAVKAGAKLGRCEQLKG
jgi:hypothetical protein